MKFSSLHYGFVQDQSSIIAARVYEAHIRSQQSGRGAAGDADSHATAAGQQLRAQSHLESALTAERISPTQRQQAAATRVVVTN